MFLYFNLSWFAKVFCAVFLHSDLSSLYGINPKIRLLCDRPFSCATREIDQVAKVNRQQTIELICVFFFWHWGLGVVPGVGILLVVLRIYFVVMSLCVVLKVALCFVLKWSQRQQRSQLPKSGTGFWVITPVLIIRITLTFTTRLDRFKDIRTTWYPTSVTCYVIPRST